jgi:serine protease inhibitor
MNNQLFKMSFLASLAMLVIGCKSIDVENPDDSAYQQKIFLNEKAAVVVDANNTFGLKLFSKINESTPANENIVVSPLSVSIALGMTMNGADGDTRTAMENTLELQGMQAEAINESYQTLIHALTTVDPDVTMEIPNSIWHRNDFEVIQDFIDVNQDYFTAEVNPLNFDDPASVDIINNWVAESTHDKITTILDQIDPSAVMFLINAVYFKGTWNYEFDEQYTEPAAFYLADGTTKQVDMMKQEATLHYTSNNLFEAVDLYYGSGNFSMVIMLPKGSNGPDDIITQMNDETWNTWMNSFSEFNIQLSLPKFKIEYDKQMKETLTELGMGIAFDPSDADFSKINAFYELFIGFVKHKTYIDVNEEGTEAAAVTIVGMYTTSIGEGDVPYSFMVNKPFLFAIKEKDTDAVLFLGKVMEPEYEE